ncbi:MAG: hypothetical protein GW903_05335 [Alphaproteobacteria bacterium]|nr:hypothetical protein [Alphaproteobacteria bacterium]NCQ88988.1 hypothetical protein [Alphaproteobacteria bacterium]NCT07889.1 hypothetical protein [Alphaproteobacteria bacterium]
MNDNKKSKSLSTLSEQLSGIFDHMDYIDGSFKRIEAYAKKKHSDIEREINPDKNCDVSRELQYHTANFLRNIANDFEKKNRLND